MSRRGAEPSVASIVEAFNKDGRKFDAEFAAGTKITGIDTDDDPRLDQRRKDDPGGQLFPLLQPTTNGHAKNVSRRFNESCLQVLRINDPRRRLDAFRTTFITRMSELNVNLAMLMALIDHHKQTAVDLSSPSAPACRTSLCSETRMSMPGNSSPSACSRTPAASR